MPPESASLTCSGEVVDVALPGADGALRDVLRAIRPPALHLPYAVPAHVPVRTHQTNAAVRGTRIRNSKPRIWIPVYGDVTANMVHHLNHETITFSDDDPWPRELPVDRHNALCPAQPRRVP